VAALRRAMRRETLTRMMGRGAVVALSVVLVACGGQQPEPRGVQMNQFIPDEKLAAVKICQTTGQELLRDLGPPNGQGRDGDFATFSWTALAMVVDPGQMAMGSQGVYAWVDGNGLVANFVVNPTSIPQTPQACGGVISGDSQPAESAPLPAKKKPDEA
jgi:hypothetical protein